MANLPLPACHNMLRILFPIFVDTVWFEALLWIRSACSLSWGRFIRLSLHPLLFDGQGRRLLLGRSNSKGADPLMPGAGLPVYELAPAAPHAVHFLLQTAPVSAICQQLNISWCQIMHKMFWRWAESLPWENVSVRIKLVCHPCNLFQVGMRSELVREELLPVELLVELKPAIDIFVRQCLSMVGTKSFFLVSITFMLMSSSTYLWCLARVWQSYSPPSTQSSIASVSKPERNIRFHNAAASKVETGPELSFCAASYSIPTWWPAHPGLEAGNSPPSGSPTVQSTNQGLTLNKVKPIRWIRHWNWPNL